MSMINKLNIQGIRSFGDDRQKIEFSTPLTLIVGENGCGKTTIIECLKYALTGDFPTNSDKGKNFVHDVKLMTNQKKSDARVELTITDPNGVDKTVFRAMRVEMYKGKPKFQTFDSTIKYSDSDDSKFISGRVDDINNHMCESMGVSKAILNNVIFCHQEDSNWPLDEGKKLKEKFDAIFGTTEYNNAINKIGKIRKTYELKLKEAEFEKKAQKELKIEVERKEFKIQDFQSKLENIKKEYDEFEQKMAPLDAKKEQIMIKERDFAKLMIEKKSFESTIINKEEESAKLEGKIKKKLVGTIDDLECEMANFIENQQEKKDELKSLQSQHTKLVSEERENQKSLSDLNLKASNITDKIQKLQELKSERFGKVKDICSTLELDFDYDADQAADTQDIGDTLKDIRRHIVLKEKNIQSLKKLEENDEQKFQGKIDELREERTKIETNLKTQRDSLNVNKASAVKIQKELKDSEESIPMLNELTPAIAKYEKKLNKLNEENKVDELREQQEGIGYDVIELEDTLHQLENDIEILQSVSRVSVELDSKQNDLSKDQKEFDRIKNKLSSSLKNLFGKQTVDANFRSKVQSKREELESEVKGIKDRLQNIQREHDRMQDQRTNLRAQQKQKDQEIHKIEQDIGDVCMLDEYLDYLASQKEKVEKLNMELAVKESSKNTYKDFIDKINDTPCCPLCHKNLEDDADKLKAELEENIEELPRKITALNTKLTQERKTYEKLLQLKSSYDNLDKLNKEKSKLETQQKEFESKIKQKAEEKENLESVVAEPEGLLNIISQSFFADICKLDDLQRTIATKTKDVNALKSKLPSNVPKKSLQEAQAERKELSEKIKANNEKVKQLNEEINSFQAELMNTRERLNDLNQKKNEYQERVQKMDLLKNQLKQLKEDRNNLEEKVKENEENLVPTIKKLESCQIEMKKTRDQHKYKIDKEQNIINKLKVDQAEIERLERDIDGLEKMNLEKDLERLKSNVDKIKAAEKSIQEQIKKKAIEIQELNSVLANEETTYRNIMDNIDLLKLAEDKVEAEKNLAKLESRIGNLDFKKMSKEKNELLNEIDKIITNRQKMAGREGELKNQLKVVEMEMKEPKYKEAKKKYNDAVIEEAVMSAAVDDLKKYAAALEKALLKYHQEKMDQINQIMKELWNSIYQGNDIDHIMIKTEEEETATVTKTEKSRRSYSYRVVQVKGGAEIDMRGRCSAGQKVLASLIIRIALSDTFSSSCGILALDEPTTNLDHNNVTSLSNALGQLVAERDNGRFMLIIITHDENFVRTLERAEKYYKLSRDNFGCSVIEEYRNY
ncbi:DNA repair protein RAD50 [Chironomus tepperi]|uniref:DNA repair protein RAD50 n=1 Tax=Chironomus tepperi TaxID=113505 RepID=UPI00391F3BF4